MLSAWPALEWEEHPWLSIDPALSRRQQLLAQGPYRAAVPHPISSLALPPLDGRLAAEVEDAVAELNRFDAEVGHVTAPFAAILLRSESASSSEIEQLTASPKNIALAELGMPTGANPRLIVANVRAMEAAVDLAGDLDEAAVLRMHAALLADSRPDFVGGWRRQQVWIGSGLSSSPHTAAFVPPHHDRIPELMADLMAFARRLDLPVLPQVAVAHAQFETVHPFADGNGRTGRALVHAMLHRLGVTRSVTVPVSAGLLSDVDAYFAALTEYRDGRPEPIITSLARACLDGVANGRRLVAALEQFRSAAFDRTSARRGSAGWRAIDVLVRQPVITAAALGEALGVTPQNAQNGIDRLVADGILTEASGHRRYRFYQARSVLDALDDFARRARRSRGG